MIFLIIKDRPEYIKIKLFVGNAGDIGRNRLSKFKKWI